MIPGTQFNTTKTSVFRNIFVEDPPQVLFSLEIVPLDCSLIGLGNCPDVLLTMKSKLNLNIENPQSVVANSIGFGILDAGYTSITKLGTQYFPSDYTLTGSMNIGLTNVFIKAPPGIWLPLISADAMLAGKIGTTSASQDAWVVSIVPFSSFANLAPNKNVSGVLQGDLIKGIQQSSGGVKFGSTIEISGELDARNNQDASSLADVVRFFMNMAQTNAPSHAELGKLLQNLTVNTEANAVKVSLAIPEIDLEMLFRMAGHQAPKI